MKLNWQQLAAIALLAVAWWNPDLGQIVTPAPSPAGTISISPAT